MAVVLDPEEMFDVITWGQLHSNELRLSILDRVYAHSTESVKD